MLLTEPQRISFLRSLRDTGSRAFATTAASCTLRDAVYTRDRVPGFEIAWRRAEALVRLDRP